MATVGGAVGLGVPGPTVAAHEAHGSSVGGGRSVGHVAPPLQTVQVAPGFTHWQQTVGVAVAVGDGPAVGVRVCVGLGVGV